MSSPIIGRRRALSLSEGMDRGAVDTSPLVKVGKEKKEIYKPSDAHRDFTDSVNEMHTLILNTKKSLKIEKGILEKQEHTRFKPSQDKIKQLEDRIKKLTKVHEKYNEAVKSQNFQYIQNGAKHALDVVIEAKNDIGPEWAFEKHQKVRLTNLKNSVLSDRNKVAKLHNKLFKGVKSLKTLFNKKNEKDKKASKWLKSRMIAQNNNTKLLDKWQGKSSKEIKNFSTRDGFTYKNLKKTCNTLAELYKNHKYLDIGVAAREAKAKVEHDAILKSQDERHILLNSYIDKYKEIRRVGDKIKGESFQVVYHYLKKEKTEIKKAIDSVIASADKVRNNRALTKKQKEQKLEKLNTKYLDLDAKKKAITNRLVNCNLETNLWNPENKRALKAVEDWRKWLVSWEKAFSDAGSQLRPKNAESLPEMRSLKKRWDKHVLAAKKSLSWLLYELEDCLPAHFKEFQPGKTHKKLDFISDLEKLDEELDKVSNDFNAAEDHRVRAATELDEVAERVVATSDRFNEFLEYSLPGYFVNILNLEVDRNSNKIKDLKAQLARLKDSKGPVSRIKRMRVKRQIDDLEKTNPLIRADIHELVENGNYGRYSSPLKKPIEKKLTELKSIGKKMEAANGAVDKALNEKKAKAYYEKVHDFCNKTKEQLVDIHNFLVASSGVAKKKK